MRIVILCLMFAAVVLAEKKTVHVKEHTTKTGKVVKAHERTSGNKDDSDNWSTKGNVNPTTGKRGTKQSNTKKTR